jgi:hypothetical protein
MSRKTNAEKKAISRSSVVENLPKVKKASILATPKKKLTQLFVILVLGLVAATTVLSFVANQPAPRNVTTQATTNLNPQNITIK